MPRSKFQRAVVGTGYTLGGFLLLGSILDSTTTALALIPPALTYWGSAVLPLLAVGFHLSFRRRPVRWVAKGGRELRITGLGPQPILGVLGAILLLWVPRLSDSMDAPRTKHEFGPDSLPVYSRSGVEVEGPHFRMWPTAMIDGLVLGDTGRQARYSRSRAEYEEGLAVRPDDEVLVSVLFVNPAAAEYSTAHTARIVANFDTMPQKDHFISAALAMDNGQAIYSSQLGMGGRLRLRSEQRTKLVYIPGSTYMCVRRPPTALRYPPVQDDPTGACSNATPTGPVQLLRLPDGIANDVARLGDLPGLYSGTVVFALRVDPASSS
jgi:hypothetical protein